VCSWLGQIRDIRATCIRIYIISISNNILTWVPKIHAYISVSTFVVASVCVSFAINLINESNHILTCIPKISTWEQVRGCVDFEICIQHVYACTWHTCPTTHTRIQNAYVHMRTQKKYTCLCVSMCVAASVLRSTIILTHKQVYFFFVHVARRSQNACCTKISKKNILVYVSVWLWLLFLRSSCNMHTCVHDQRVGQHTNAQTKKYTKQIKKWKYARRFMHQFWNLYMPHMHVSIHICV